MSAEQYHLERARDLGLEEGLGKRYTKEDLARFIYESDSPVIYQDQAPIEHLTPSITKTPLAHRILRPVGRLVNSRKDLVALTVGLPLSYMLVTNASDFYSNSMQIEDAERQAKCQQALADFRSAAPNFDLGNLEENQAACVKLLKEHQDMLEDSNPFRVTPEHAKRLGFTLSLYGAIAGTAYGGISLGQLVYRRFKSIRFRFPQPTT